MFPKVLFTSSEVNGLMLLIPTLPSPINVRGVTPPLNPKRKNEVLLLLCGKEESDHLLLMPCLVNSIVFDVPAIESDSINNGLDAVLVELICSFAAGVVNPMPTFWEKELIARLMKAMNKVVFFIQQFWYCNMKKE